jgi:hypothetical protein
MSNAAARNPRSTQYRGQWPEHVIGAAFVANEAPTADWTEANPNTNPEECPDEHKEVVFMLHAQMVFPSQLVPQDKWKMGQVPLLVFKKIPYLELRAMVEAQIAEAAGAPPDPDEVTRPDLDTDGDLKP